MRTRQIKTFSNLKPVLRSEVRYRAEPQGAIVFDRVSLGIYATNPAGLLILNEINRRKSCPQIVDRLQRQFVSTPRRTLQRELRRFLADLAGIGLIDFVEESGCSAEKTIRFRRPKV